MRWDMTPLGPGVSGGSVIIGRARERTSRTGTSGKLHTRNLRIVSSAAGTYKSWGSRVIHACAATHFCDASSARSDKILLRHRLLRAPERAFAHGASASSTLPGRKPNAPYPELM